MHRVRGFNIKHLSRYPSIKILGLDGVLCLDVRNIYVHNIYVCNIYLILCPVSRCGLFMCKNMYLETFQYFISILFPTVDALPSLELDGYEMREVILTIIFIININVYPRVPRLPSE